MFALRTCKLALRQHSLSSACASTVANISETDVSGIFKSRQLSDLIRSLLVYRACAVPSLMRGLPMLLKSSRSIYVEKFLYRVLRATAFKQFCGGETLEEVRDIVQILSRNNIGVILDYAAEPDLSPDNIQGSSEEFHDEVYENICKSMHIIKSFKGSVAAIKLSGLFNSAVLASLSQHIKEGRGITDLRDDLKTLYMKGWCRLSNICKLASDNGATLTIDAEQSFVQDAIDFIAIEAMQNFSDPSKLMIINTYQMYRRDGIRRLISHQKLSKQKNFVFGAKLVRGAYVVGERIWAKEGNYECPIYDTVEETHTSFNAAIDLVFDELLKMKCSSRYILATHNFSSIRYALDKLNLYPELRGNIGFAQLYGMSDNTTHLLAERDICVFKYVPFGPVHRVMPYLIRRAEENSSAFAHIGSDATIIQKAVMSRLFSPN